MRRGPVLSRLNCSRRAILETTDRTEPPQGRVPQARNDPPAGAVVWRWLSPAPLLDWLRDSWNPELDAAIHPVPVPIDTDDLQDDVLGAGRHDFDFETLQAARQIPGNHCRAAVPLLFGAHGIAPARPV
jgi:hypothetical protein